MNIKKVDQQNNEFEDINIIELILKDAPGYIFWKDLNSVYRGCNQNGAILYGVSSPDEVVGKTDFDFNQEFAAEFVKHDQYVIKTGKTHISESDVVTLANSNRLIIRTEKKPLRNKLGKIIGVLGYAIDRTKDRENEQLRLENETFQAEKKSQESFIKFMNEIQHSIQLYKINILHSRLGINHSVNELDEEISLTKREKEVLYYLSFGKSPKEIAQVLTILYGKEVNSKAVQAVIDKQLYMKFGVHNTGQLLEKSYLLGLMPTFLS